MNRGINTKAIKNHIQSSVHQCEDISKMVCDKESEAKSEYASMIEAGRRLILEADDDIVISGIAGDFPDCEGLTEFAEKLFNKVDLISDDDRRWKIDHPEIPQRTGKLKQVNKFDASSFGIHYNQAQSMDPMTRILMEKSYEAIIDSGFNPYSLRGSKTGVFVGACFSESEKTWFYEKLQVDGFGVTGCIRTMLANRISYAFGLDGPSYVIDTACSSSMYAFEQGYNAIREGHCDAAIIGGCNLCLHPYVSLQFARLGVLSLDGRCKVFDEAANGYCRSETIAAIFLQKKKNSRRMYATVVHAKTNCDGYKEQGITYPAGEMQQKLLEEFYQECMVDPASLAWVEAHGTGTKVGDPEEVKALYSVFCKNRKTPLKIGSVKSNLGHTEPSSGMCSIAKVIIAMETGMIPPNINFTTPRADIEYFHTGEIEVITEPTPWEGGLVGVNSFGFGGANCHGLLKWNEKGKENGGLPYDDIPRLVNVSGRTVEAVDTILGFLENSSLDAEFVKLLHDIHKDEIPSHLFRGYTIVTKTKAFKIRNIEPYGLKRPFYIQFSGLCNKWKPFDKSLIQFPAFYKALVTMSKVVGVDLLELITDPTNSMSNPIDFFLAMIASQIALYDLLQYIGVVPDGLIGISIGNLACAYADGCLNAEDAILIAYNLASILVESAAKTGKKSQGIFERNGQGEETKHLSSKILSSSKTRIIEYLKKVMKKGLSPSEKWIRTDDGTPSSAEFIYNSIVTSIDLDFGDTDLPEDYLLFNVGPKGSYEHLDFTVHELLDNEGNDNTVSLLMSIGKMYMGGVESDIAKLYPEVKYPVSRSTPMIAPLVRWNHTDDWYVTSYRLQKKIASGERIISILVSDDETEYITGHLIDGRNLFPATGYLLLVWETVGLIKGEHYTEVPIVFEDVRFLRATNMPSDAAVDFTIIVQRASGNFEVVEGGAPIVTGRCYVPEDISREMTAVDCPINDDRPCTLSAKDIYKELRLRGYNYKGLFRSVVGVNPEEKFAKIKWEKNWVAFMDNMLQIQILHEDTRGLFVPTSIEKVVIDGRKHLQTIASLPHKDDVQSNELYVYYHKEAQLVKCGGIEIRGLRANAISRRKVLAEAILEKYIFFPNLTDSEIYDIETIIRAYAQIIIEMENTVNIKGVEISDKDHSLISPLLVKMLSDLPLVQPELLIIGAPEISENDPLPPEITVEDKPISTVQSALVIVANNILDPSRNEVLQSCLNALAPGGYLITRESLNADLNNENITVLCSHVFNNERINLIRKMKKVENVATEVVFVSQDDLSWIAPSQNALKAKECKRVIFVGMDGKLSGVLGLVNCIRKEAEGAKARCVLFMDEHMPSFSLENPLYQNQLSLDMAINAYKNGQWGTYRHLKLNSSKKVKTAHIYANTLVRGDISSLSWIEGYFSPHRFPELPKNMMYIHYAALNFRDVMLASGKLAPEVVIQNRLNQDCVIGFEYSGINCSGVRSMGMLTSSALASICQYDSCLDWKVPDHWTLEEAATVPVTYATAIFGLILRGKMKRGDSVLIHAGSGGVGQAAINIALATGCIVFTTVGTPEKRKFIKETFPQIDDRHIGNSRDTSFEQLVMQETNGRGVDIVLNSLAEEKLLASVRCLAKGGRFLEIGKFDLSNNNPLGMEIFARGASFHGILLDALFVAEDRAKLVIHNTVQKYIDSGVIKPLCRHVFDLEEIENAFRFMASGKHIGKVLIKMRDEATESPLEKPKLYEGLPKFYCRPQHTYVIIGGLGGFGLELSDWLAVRGASCIVLTSRRGISNGYQEYRIKVWRSYGIKVEVVTDDISTPEGIENILKVASRHGPVAGIFNLAVVLKDGAFENQTEETFLNSLNPKAVATKHLDKLSRKMCPNLEQFVIFSSVSCGRGNGGQSNYGMSNSIMERICEKRVADGLPGLAIQWGAIGDVGIVAEMMEDHVELVIGGTLQQRITSCLEVMDQLLTEKFPIVSSMVVAEKKSSHSSSGNIVDTVVNILGIRDLKTVSVHSNLAELGMDSMMAVEIKQTLEREYEVFLSPQDIRGMTIAKLHELAATKDAPDASVAEVPDSGDAVTDEYLIITIAPEPEKYEPILKLGNPSENTSGKETLIFIPGLEGFPVVFENLTKYLDFDMYAIQMDYTSTFKSISEMTDFFLPKVLPYLKDKKFNLIGYSYGGLLSMDLVNRLEGLGYSGKVIFIDSSPDMMIDYCKKAFSDKDDATMQIKAILRTVNNSIKNFRTTELEELLREAPNFESKVDIVIKVAKSLSPLSETYMRQLFVTGYNRITLLFNGINIAEKSISSYVKLIRPTVQLLPYTNDYNLSKYCRRPVEVDFVEGDHLTILNRKATAELITDAINREEPLNKTSLLKPPTNIEIIREPSKHI